MRFIDLLITDGDLVLDAALNPVTVTDLDCIAQDIKHMLLERAMLVPLIGERNSERRALVFTRIKRAVEEDVRIRPGTVTLQALDASGEMYALSAQTMSREQLSLTLTAGA